MRRFESYLWIHFLSLLPSLVSYILSHTFTRLLSTILSSALLSHSIPLFWSSHSNFQRVPWVRPNTDILEKGAMCGCELWCKGAILISIQSHTISPAQPLKDEDQGSTFLLLLILSFFHSLSPSVYLPIHPSYTQVRQVLRFSNIRKARPWENYVNRSNSHNMSKGEG